MVTPALLWAASFIGERPRSWLEVLGVAATNYFAWFAALLLLVGIWLLFRAKGWVKAVGMLSILAGSVLLVQVLKDIRSEIPGVRGQQVLLIDRAVRGNVS